MKKLAILAATVLSMSACSTDGMRSSDPDQLYSSQKEAKVVSICIAEKWAGKAEVNSKETEEGYSVSAQMDGELRYLAKVETKSVGSVSKLYKFSSVALPGAVTKLMSNSTGADSFFAAAAGCQYDLGNKLPMMGESELRSKWVDATDRLNALYEKEEQETAFDENDEKIKDVLDDVIYLSKELRKFR